MDMDTAAAHHPVCRSKCWAVLLEVAVAMAEAAVEVIMVVVHHTAEVIHIQAAAAAAA